MAASLTFFPVSNGDMALIILDNGQRVLIDINIRAAADDEGDEIPDVATDLRDRLEALGRDGKGRLYVDSFLLSHPDADHVTGLRTHFHLGAPGDWVKDDDKIIIREMWSSPIVFRRASAEHVLCDDAKAWAAEARRRVKLFRDKIFDTGEGDRILIMGEDESGKTDDILDIVVKTDGLVTKANRVSAGAFEARLLAPLPKGDDEELEETLRKNRSSVILRFSLRGGGVKDKCRFLTGGDAEVAIWERLWGLHGKSHLDWLTYDILETPHHCSWRSLSYDRWSKLGENVKVDAAARSALSQNRKGAVVVASCKPIKKNDSNPPHERAKREYISIVNGTADRFYCTDEYWAEEEVALEFEINAGGTTKKAKPVGKAAAAALGIGGTAAHARPHG